MSEYQSAELKEFVEGYVDSFVAWDLILFFYNNPEVTGDVVTLATRLGREEEAVEVAAKTLTAKGILREEAKGIFTYRLSERTAEQIKKFVSALETTDGRLSVLLCVLEKISKRRESRRKILT